VTRDFVDYLSDMLAYALKARNFVGLMTPDELLADEKTYLATVRAIEIVGEAARHVPDDFRARFPKIPWRQIVALHSCAGRNTVTRRFGSWGKALVAAGLGDRWSEQLGSPGAKQAVIRRMSDEEVLTVLRDPAQRLGRGELTVAEVEQNLPFAGGTLRKRGGFPGRLRPPRRSHPPVVEGKMNGHR
jgi:uncharacterized protein with HEPN domain